MEIKTIIVDDEQHALDSFVKIAEITCPEIKVVATFTKPDALLEHLVKEENPDLLFLDIEMTPYSGFRLVELLQEKNKSLPDFDIIFLTAYDQYAIKAFGYNALDYLLKPLIPEDLKKALEKWKQKKYKHFHPIQWEQLHYYMTNQGKVQDRIALPTLEGYEIIHCNDIIRCEADRNYSHIFTKNGASHIVCRSLKEVENILCNHSFLRIHHSHIINPAYVLKILKIDGGSVEMTDGTQVRITRNKEENMEKLFGGIRKL
ncbi:MAG TPA: LytTR family DNA-binding domain-containing protein [Cytophagales bacterium]|nr:LytTR family DNA-binding domain-containing protein [Cytophagales bacterium]